VEDKKSTSPDKYLVPAVEQACRIIFSLAASRATQMGLMEICAEVGIHKSKAYSILQTMQAFGLVQKKGDRKGYALGPAVIALSRKVLDDLNAPRLAEPVLEELASTLGCTATLGLIAGNKVYVVAKHEGGVDLGVTIRTGHRFPLTYGSHGKAIAAFLPEAERELLLQNPKLYFHGPSGKIDWERLQLEMEQCRREGFAMDLGEMTPGLSAVAVPVFGPGEAPIGYIAMVGLFSAEQALAFGPQVVAAGKVLSRQLGARIDQDSKKAHTGGAGD
jgi:DNA-binding IclR family transcriptional regulator